MKRITKKGTETTNTTTKGGILMMMNTKKLTRTLAVTVTAAIAATTFSPSSQLAYASDIIKGSNVVDEVTSCTTTLAGGESVTAQIKNSVLTVNVGTSSYTFKVGAIKSMTDAMVINETDSLCHILTLGGAYYVLDLKYGTQFAVYRNSSNGKYCLKSNASAYAVQGKSLINSSYFWEMLDAGNSRELLLTRAEADKIEANTDPSVEEQKPSTDDNKQEEQKPSTDDNKQEEQKPSTDDNKQEEQKPSTDDNKQEEQKPTTETPTTTTVSKTEFEATATTSAITNVTVDTTTKSEFDFTTVWQAYLDGKLTWEQLQVLVGQFNWTTKTASTEESTTNYVYDETGKLIQEKTVTTKTGTEAGSGNTTSTETTTGKAETTVVVVVTGTGVATEETKSHTDAEAKTDAVTQVAGTATTTTTTTGNTSTATTTPTTTTTTVTKTKNKKSYWVVKSATGKRTKLVYGTTKKHKVVAWIVLKDGTMIYNGIKVKGVKAVGFIKKTKNVSFMTKNGVVKKIKLAATTADAKTTVICKNAKSYRTNKKGFLTTVVLKNNSTKGITGK